MNQQELLREKERIQQKIEREREERRKIYE